jgi:hypothetical protein
MHLHIPIYPLKEDEQHKQRNCLFGNEKRKYETDNRHISFPYNFFAIPQERQKEKERILRIHAAGYPGDGLNSHRVNGKQKTCKKRNDRFFTYLLNEEPY